MIRRALLLFVCLFAFARFAVAEGTALSGTVRVSLTSLSGRQEIHVSFAGSYTVGKEIPVPRGAAGVVRAEEGTVSLYVDGQRTAQGKTIWLRRHLAAGENGLRIEEARIPANLYPGDLLVAENDGCVQPVLYVYLEDYLPGVLPYEMDESFPAEALAAQAIAARTYALRKMSLQGPEYDLVDTTADQVYCGTPGSCENAMGAIAGTWGTVGMVQGGFMPTYYTASNGGQTETAEHAWGGKTAYDFPVQDDPYDLENGNSAVRSVLFYRSGMTSSEELNLLLASRVAYLTGRENPKIRGITNVAVGSPKFAPPSRLYTALTVRMAIEGYGEAEAVFDYFSEIEPLCGLSLNVLQNELITVEEGEAGFRLSARRLGHGVGMSQRGAEEMANRGRTAAEILAFYYPGSALRKYTLTRQILPALDGLTYPDSAPAAEAVQRILSPGHALDRADLRAAPGENAPVLMQLNSGTRVALLSEGVEYSLVQSGMTAGYVKSAFLRDDAETPEPEAGETVVRVRLADEEQMLNLRAAPGVTGEVIGHLRSGERLLLLMAYGSWSCVRHGDTIGFVKSEYLEPEEAATAESPRETEIPRVAADPAYNAPPPSESIESISESIPARVMAERGLVLRAVPSAEGTALLVMPEGASLSVLSFNVQNGYVRVLYQGTEGYAALAYLMRDDGEEGAAEALETPMRRGAELTPVPPASRILREEAEESRRVAVTSGNGLHLRAAPRPDGESLYVLPYGTVLTVTGEETNGFLPVRWGAYRGYVAAAYTEALP